MDGNWRALYARGKPNLAAGRWRWFLSAHQKLRRGAKKSKCWLRKTAILSWFVRGRSWRGRFLRDFPAISAFTKLFFNWCKNQFRFKFIVGRCGKGFVS